MKSSSKFDENSNDKDKYLSGKGSDLSVLRKPILTSMTGFNEAVRAFQNGTEELRQLMTQECDTIYECKVCRNIFRSLGNFISHKRVYCRTKFNSNNHFEFPQNGFKEQDVNRIVLQEEKQREKETASEASNKKDLGSVIDKLLAKKQATSSSKLSDYYEQIQHKIMVNELSQRRHLLHLDQIAESKVAVFQTVNLDGGDQETIDGGGAMKKEVEEVHDLLCRKHFVVGPDGKALKIDEVQRCSPDICDMISSSDKDSLNLFGNFNDSVDEKTTNGFENDELRCHICDVRFETEKTLKIHIELRHITSTKVYQCPSCSKTFLQPSSVIKHLSNDHKKSGKRIRQMRDTIFRRRMRIDEVQIRGPSRELNRLQSEKERTDAEKAYLDNMENFDRSNQSMCTYCNKIFERKAVLTSHLANCRLKFQKMHTLGLGGTGAKRGPKPKEPQPAQATKDLNQDENSSSTVQSLDDSGEALKIVETNDPKDMVMGTLEDENEYKLIDNAAVLKRKRKQAMKSSEKNKIDETPQNDDGIAPTEELNYFLDERNGIKKFKKEDRENGEDEDQKKDFFCHICNKSFLAQSNLKRHNVMFHYFKNRYLCKICNHGTFRKSELVIHLTEEHEISSETHEVKDYIIAAQEKNDSSFPDTLDILENGEASNHSKSVDGYDDSTSNSSVKDQTATVNSLIDPPVSEPRRKRGRPRGSFKVCRSESNSVERVPRVIKKEVEFEKYEKSSGRDSKRASPVPPDQALSKRPIRNRVKPIDKDFVYDLSNLLYDQALSSMVNNNKWIETNGASKVAKKRNSNAEKYVQNGDGEKKKEFWGSGMKIKRSFTEDSSHFKRSSSMDDEETNGHGSNRKNMSLDKISNIRHSLDKPHFTDNRFVQRRSSDDILIKRSIPNGENKEGGMFLGFEEEEEEDIGERILLAKSEAIKRYSAALGIDYDAMVSQKNESKEPEKKEFVNKEVVSLNFDRNEDDDIDVKLNSSNETVSEVPSYEDDLFVKLPISEF